jgi:hypothetical protein
MTRAAAILSCRRGARAIRGGAGALLLLVAPAARAQQEDEQLWLQANTNVPLSDEVRVTLEQIARFSDRQEGLYQTEFGALFSYRVARGVEIGAGYRKVGTHNRNSAANEDRLRQQMVATFGRFSSRFRIDERFNPRGGEIGFRIRPLLRYNHRIDRRGTALFVSHESFYLPNGTRWGQRRGYERMRNIVGIMLRPGGDTSLDLGYLNQFRPGRDGGRDQMDHALTLQLTINLHRQEVAPLHD